MKTQQTPNKNARTDIVFGYQIQQISKHLDFLIKLAENIEIDKHKHRKTNFNSKWNGSVFLW